MGNTFYFEWEVKLMEWLQSIVGTGIGAKIFSIITLCGEEFVCIAVIGFLYWGYNKELGKTVGINVYTALVLYPLFKNIALRRRPYMDHPGIKILKPVDSSADIYDIAAQGYSFPSGHSTNSATVFGTLGVYGKKRILKVLAILLPLLVGTSRFVLGAHYPTDVLCGFALGACVVFFAPWLRKKLGNDGWFYLVLCLIGLPGFFYCKSNDFFTGYGILVGASLGFIFEEHFVDFKETKSIFRCILRVVIGGGLYLVLNELFKMPFNAEFLASGTLPAFLVRTARYALMLFLLVGVYPIAFNYTSKIGRKKN